MIELETAFVRLGERDFSIRTAGFARAKPWKKQLLAEVQPLFEQIGAAQDLKFESPADLLKLLPLVEMVFSDSIEKLLDLLIAYAPNLEPERGYIEAEASDKQILAAFQEVVKLADPFGITRLMMGTFGLQQNGIPTSSLSVSGA